MTSQPRDDQDRYPFVVTVTDVFEKGRPVAFGAEDGHVICSGANWWKADGATAADIKLKEEAIGLAWTAAVRLARKQRGESS